MKIHGKDINFMLTVEAKCKILDLCSDDTLPITSIFEGSYQKSQHNAAKFMAYLAEGYESNQKFQNPEGYEPQTITAEEFLSLPETLFSSAFDEALNSFIGEKPTIETAPEKGKKKAVTKSA